MKFIVLDRDRDSCDHIIATLESAGFEAEAAASRSTAVQMFVGGGYDAIFFDPVPQIQLNEIRSFAIGVRRPTSLFPPIIVVSHAAMLDLSKEELQSVGVNAFLDKPFSAQNLIEKANDAKRLVETARMMADTEEDFPSQGGIIAKSAFSQLFLTCLDRADRYGEDSYLVTVVIDNLDDIATNDGADAAARVADKLRQVVTRTRRLSDIAGHVEMARFCLLLLRPSREDEPVLAANRFAESLKAAQNELAVSETPPVIRVSLLAIPSGIVTLELLVERQDEDELEIEAEVGDV